MTQLIVLVISASLGEPKIEKKKKEDNKKKAFSIFLKKKKTGFSDIFEAKLKR